MTNDKVNINVISIIKTLLDDKRSLCLYSCVAGLIGLLFALTTPKTYKSVVVLAPEESGNGFYGSISSVASLVGMDLKMAGLSGDAIYPEIYPELMKSSEFIVDLFSVKVTTKKTKEQFIYQDYIENHQKTAIYEYPLKMLTSIAEALKGDGEESDGKHKPDPHDLTVAEDKVARTIQKKIACVVDSKTSLITITVEDQDPKIAATVADSVQVHLQRAITDYRTKKARKDLVYIEQLCSEAYAQYQKTRQKYSSFADSNNGLVMQSVQAVLNELENDMQMKYNIYERVEEQLQLARAKVQERTPAFTVVQGARVPVKHSNMSKIAILCLWMILGLALRFVILGYKKRRTLFNLSEE